MRFLLFYCLTGLLSFQLAANGSVQEPAKYPRGEIIGPIVSASAPSQRYAVYLPSALDPKKPAPILYIMDYRGRGRVAAGVFQAAAEQFGWIIMSSYNTLSDSEGEPNVLAMKTMWNDSHDMFTIDDQRVYVAGLSGTARIATLLGRRSSVKFTGVIGAAAGFHPDVPPSKETPFLYYGTAGTVDYNYWEMRGVAEKLTRLGLPHRIAFFDGAHGWMPPDLATAAVAWMELRAMQSGDREIDAKVVDERWSRDLERTRALEADGSDWEASRLLASLASDYAKLRSADEISEVTRRARQFGSTAKARSQAHIQAHASARHESRVERAMLIIADAYPPDAEMPAATVAATVKTLDLPRLQLTARGANAEEALAAARVLAELDVQTGLYLPVSAIRSQDYQRARFYLGVALAVRSDDAYAWYLRAALDARMRQPDRAIESLERAISLGFRTVDALEQDPSFTSLRQRPEFVRLLNGLRETVR